VATKSEVLALAKEGLVPVEIAERLGCRSEYVRATLRRNGLANDIITHRRQQIKCRLENLRTEIRSLEDELATLRR